MIWSTVSPGAQHPRAVCSGPHTISAASVLTDVYRARDLLAAHPRIDVTRIALMGFSFGGRTALWASHPRFQQRYGVGPAHFAAHLAFYPTSCHIRLADEDRVGDAPIRIFHGKADEVTIISRCREYIAKLRNAGKDAGLFEYAGAKHWFDNALSNVTRRRMIGGLAAGVGAVSVTSSNISRARAQSAQKTFVLVGGAFYGAWCWRRVSDRLEKQGHKAYALTLTGLADRSHLLSNDIDLDTARDSLISSNGMTSTFA